MYFVYLLMNDVERKICSLEVSHLLKHKRSFNGLMGKRGGGAMQQGCK